MDPPAHTAFRRLVVAGLHAAAGRPRSSRRCGRSSSSGIERLRDAGGGDIVAELFKPLPSMVVAHYLGVPRGGPRRFDGWTDAIVAANAAGRPAATRPTRSAS